MRGKSAKGASANPSRTSVSPGTIRKYTVLDSSKESPGNPTGAKSKTPECLSKTGRRRQLAETFTRTTGSELTEEATTDLQQEKQLPTKGEMAEMFAELETSIKGEIEILRENMDFKKS